MAEHKTLHEALLTAQRSCDRHSEAEALRAVGRLSYRPARTRGRSDVERFLPRVTMGLSDCWIWLGALSNLGYGLTGTPIQDERTAHRAAFRLFKGDIPEGLHVLHSCDVRCCVNPEHLSLGTHRQNMQDMARKGRGCSPRLRGERNPMSRLTPVQVEEIRHLHAHGTSAYRLARVAGVSPMTVFRLLRGEAWR